MKSQWTQITPPCKIIEIKSIESQKKSEKLLAPFQMIGHELDNDLLTKKSCN